MKKSTIWLLAVIMALTFIGLLYVQIMYMENMIKMRNEQFTEAVKREPIRCIDKPRTRRDSTLFRRISGRGRKEKCSPLMSKSKTNKT